MVKKTLSCGTTTACYYATTHKQSSVILAETCARLGQRAFVGKVIMVLLLGNLMGFYYQVIGVLLLGTFVLISGTFVLISGP